MGRFTKEKKEERKTRSKNIKEREEDKKGGFRSVEPKTRHGILAIVSFLIAFFFILAPLGGAGKAGTVSYEFLEYLFGFGFFILPILSVILGLSFAQETRPHFAGTTLGGGLLFFLSALGLVSALFGEPKGGLIGGFVTAPLLSFFDVYFTVIALAGLLFISLLLIFSAGLPRPTLALFRRKKEEEITPLPNTTQPAVHVFSEQNPETKNERTVPEKKDDKQKKKDDIGYSFYALRRGIYAPPPLDLLEEENAKPVYGDIKANSNLIKRTLANFGVEVEIDDVSVGPSVARYAIKPAEGVRLAKIVALQDNLALALAAHPLRIEAPIPGKSLVGIEIPNKKKAIVGLRSLLGLADFREARFPLSLALGQGVTGTPFYADLGRAPHMLIAGATGSGKSVAIHSLIISLLYRNSPDMLRFIMIDPKRVELTAYNKIPHLATPVITDAKKAIKALNWAIIEMDRRYGILETVGVRDIDSYHKNIVAKADTKKGSGKETEGPEGMPFIVIIIDELADIMQLYPRELEGGIVRLAQKSRAVGIHLVLSTQRPSVNVVTGLIKANIPSRVALQVNSQVDSRTILDQAGAEKLLGQGDMLYLGSDMAKPVRLQCPFVSEGEIRKVAKYLADSYDTLPSDAVNIESADPVLAKIDLDSMPDKGTGSDEEDEFIDEAQAIVIETGRASTSFLQRRMGLGYARAAKIMDQLEHRGVIGPANGAKPREVYGSQTKTEGGVTGGEPEEEVF
jgi:S-DNA-T family DNA segregation ATPase FtsK/SpoIIIE